MDLCFRQGYRKELVLSLGSFDLGLHPIVFFNDRLALVLDDLNGLVMSGFDFHELIKLVLEPVKLFFKLNDSDILSEFGLLLATLVLEELQFLLNLEHVHLVGIEEVVFVLSKDSHKFLIEGLQHGVDLAMAVHELVYVTLDVSQQTFSVFRWALSLVEDLANRDYEVIEVYITIS